MNKEGLKDMPCAICNSSTNLLTHPKFLSTYQECTECGFISKEARHYLSPEQEWKEYENHENSLDDTRYIAYFERFLEAAVFPFTGEGKVAFDFGSGPVPVLSQLMERDYGYQFDIYDKFYAIEKSYQGKTFDLITSTEVLEHIADPIPTFKELAALLKEDGILAIMTLFRPQDLERFFGWHYMREPSHVSFFTERSMEIIAAEAGLSIVYCDHQRYTTFKRKAR